MSRCQLVEKGGVYVLAEGQCKKPGRYRVMQLAIGVICPGCDAACFAPDGMEPHTEITVVKDEKAGKGTTAHLRHHRQKVYDLAFGSAGKTVAWSGNPARDIREKLRKAQGDGDG